MAITAVEFRVAAYLFCGYALLWFATLLIALRRGFAWRRSARARAALGPQIREALIDCLAGNNDLTRLKGFVRTSPADVGDAVLSFQGTVGGSALDRLCELTLELALAHEWCEQARSKDVMRRRRAFARLAFISSFEPCRRVAGELLVQGLKDPDVEVRLAATRGLVQSGEIADIEHVFEQAVSHSLLIRVLLTEDLRRHAIGLCEGVLPRILDSEESKRIVGTLDILKAWERALPLTGLEKLLNRADPEIRRRALELAHLVPFTPEIRTGVLECFSDEHLEVRILAARSAARLKLKDAVPLLAHCLRNGPLRLAQAAAASLAALPPFGWSTLEELCGSPNAMTATEARAALERARKVGV